MFPKTNRLQLQANLKRMRTSIFAVKFCAFKWTALGHVSDLKINQPGYLLA